MSREDWVAIAVRLFAIFLLVTLARQLPSLVAVTDEEYAALAPVYVGTAVVLLSGLILCAFLWFFPLTIARKLLPVMKEPHTASTVGPSSAMSLGITLLGVWMLTTAVPDAAYWITVAVVNRRMALQYPVDFVPHTAQDIAGMVSTAVQLVIALGMILGSTGIRGMIERYRRGGERVADAPDDAPPHHTD